MKVFKERLEKIEVEEPVHIPNLDGTGIAETVKVKVPAWRDPKDGEIYFDTEATDILDRVKARHMGLLTPEQIKTLRERLGLTQKQISELLQIGEKTWTRWENGRERPLRSINVLLHALRDGKIDVGYLQSLAKRRNAWASRISEAAIGQQNPWLSNAQQFWEGSVPESGAQQLEEWISSVITSFHTQTPQREFGFVRGAKLTPFLVTCSETIKVQTAMRPILPEKKVETKGARFDIPENALAA